MKNKEKIALLPPDELPDELRDNMTFYHKIVIVAILLGILIEGLVPHSFGTIIANFQSYTNKSRDLRSFTVSQFQLNWLPTLTSAIPCFLLPLFVVWFQKAFGYYQILSITGFFLLAISCGISSFVNQWQLFFISYSFVYSIGGSLFLAIVVLISTEYFPKEHKYHVLATSFYQIGYPMASMVGNTLLAFLILNSGWENCLQLMAVVELVGGIVISCFLRSQDFHGYYNCLMDTLEEDSTVDPTEFEEEDFSSFSMTYILRTYQMWPWLIGKYFNYTCWYGLRTNIVTYLVKSTNFGLMRSAILMSIYAAAELCVAVVILFIGDRFQGWLIHIHILSAVLSSILTGIYMSVLSTYLSAILLMVGIGMSIQLSLSFGYPASVEVWNSDMNMKTCWILTNVAAGLGIITSPLFSGLLMDYFGDGCLLFTQCVGWAIQGLLFTFTLILLKVDKFPSKSKYIELE